MKLLWGGMVWVGYNSLMRGLTHLNTLGNLGKPRAGLTSHGVLKPSWEGSLLQFTQIWGTVKRAFMDTEVRCLEVNINTRSLPLSEIAHPVKLYTCVSTPLCVAFWGREMYQRTCQRLRHPHMCSVFPRKRSCRCDIVQLSHPRMYLFLQTGMRGESNTILCKQVRDTIPWLTLATRPLN